MPCSWKNHDRYLLGPCPVKHVAQRDDDVFLAVNHQRVLAHRAQWKPADGRCNQYQISRIELFGRRRRNRTAEGKARQQFLDIAEPSICEAFNRKQILKLTTAVVKFAIAFPNAPEIETNSGIAERMKRLGERLHNFVVQGSTMKRMRVGNDRVAFAFFTGIGDNNLDAADRTVNFNSLVDTCFQIRKRSTTTPLIRCLSIISSTSC